LKRPFAKDVQLNDPDTNRKRISQLVFKTTGKKVW
jgi:hypothetical protein